MKSRFMKVLSAMLSVCMVISAIPTASAVDLASNTGTNNPGENLVNDVSVTGTNSFGKMFSEIYNENSSKQETTGYGVYSVEFTDNVATVKYDALQTATLVVGLFEEKNSSSMIISEEIEVTKDNTVTEITFDSAKMPEYFYVKAYLVDSETFRPLSTEYTSPMYTEDMQKLEKLSTTDFPEEQVLNLDDDTENNFAVYNDDVKVVSETAETNIVKTVDDTNGVYVFENIDSSISSLKPGDTFSYAYGEEDGLIIAKVSDITIDGTTATITSDELEMDQVFDYVKIDVAPTINQAEINADEMSDGVVYNALAGDNTRAKVSRGVAPVPSGVSISDDKTSSLVFELFDVKPNEIYKKKTGSELSNKNPLKYITINGSLSAEITPGIEYKFATGDDYFQFKVDYSVGFNVTCTAEYEYEKPTEATQPTEPGNSDATEPSNSDATEPGNSDATEPGNSDATEPGNSDATEPGNSDATEPGNSDATEPGNSDATEPGNLDSTEPENSGDVVTRSSGAIGVESSSSIIDKYVTIGLGSLIFTPVAGVTIKITPGFAFSVSGEISIAGSLSGTSGFKTSDGVWEDLTTTPKLEIELKVEASLFIGISLNPEASFLAGLANAELEGVLGVEVSGSMSLLSADTGEGFYVEPSVHDCDKCIAGEVVAKLTISFSANILNKEKLKLEADLLNIEFKICDFYYSFDHNSFAFSECPFQKHRITVNTVDSSGEPIKFTEITVKDMNDELVELPGANDYAITDEKGKVSFYLQPGGYDVFASDAEGKYREASKGLIVSSIAKSIYITLFTHDENADDSYNQDEDISSELSFGRNHSACITENGDLYMWGNNSIGHLGIGTTSVGKFTPIKTKSDVISVSLGVNHSACVTTDGNLYTWGHNAYYQLGDGTTTNRYEPTHIMSNVRTVELGCSVGAAITKDNDLYTWGKDNGEVLGNGTAGIQTTPQKILSDVKMVNIGNDHGAAITIDGDLYMWGNNGYGKVGTGDKNSTLYKSPQFIMSGVKSVSLGNYHSACITENGDLYMWGSNYSGQIGNGTIDNMVYVPEFIMGNVKQVSLGNYHSACITENGELYMWGSNYLGVLGDGTGEDKLTPTKITTITEIVKEIELGEHYTGVITESGQIYTWGYNTGHGCLGDGTTATRYTPTKITLPTDESGTVSSYSNSSTILSSTPNVTTAVTSGTGTSATKSFDSLMPNETYNFYAMKSKNALEPLSSENLLYISQAISDENGNLTIDYTMTEDYSKAVCFVVPMKQTDLSNALVTMDNLEYSGEEQFINPTVTLDGVALTQGKDYELCNYYYAQNPGEYKVIIRGIGNYMGELEFTYYVNGQLGDVNLDGNISIVDAILTLRHIVNSNILNSQQQASADVNKDELITVVDAIMIQRIIIGLIPSA